MSLWSMLKGRPPLNPRPQPEQQQQQLRQHKGSHPSLFRRALSPLAPPPSSSTTTSTRRSTISNSTPRSGRASSRRSTTRRRSSSSSRAWGRRLGRAPLTWRAFFPTPAPACGTTPPSAAGTTPGLSSTAMQPRGAGTGTPLVGGGSWSRGCAPEGRPQGSWTLLRGWCQPGRSGLCSPNPQPKLRSFHSEA